MRFVAIYRSAAGGPHGHPPQFPKQTRQRLPAVPRCLWQDKILHVDFGQHAAIFSYTFLDVAARIDRRDQKRPVEGFRHDVETSAEHPAVKLSPLF